MSTLTPEPGARLGGRYRLEDRVGAGSGWVTWKAIDEMLARPITVLTFAPEFPRIADVVTAARAASRLTDARLAQIFDVDEEPNHAYVVTEWMRGDSLDDLVADGPLDPGQGAQIIAQSAEALASAHAAGAAHLCLTPGSLRWTGGEVKIGGLGIDAALAGVTADDPALADTQSLGKLLYAALTGRWPGGDWPSGSACGPWGITVSRPPGAAPPAHPPPSTSPVTVLKPASAHGFDPLSSVSTDPGDENTNRALFAIDGNPDTAWHTQYYFGNPRFGGLKSGTGLILNMGKRVAVASVTVTFGPVPGANVRIEVGNYDARAPATLQTFTTVARERDVSGRVKFTANAASEGRFVLIWFTRLPPRTAGSTSRFEAEIFNVVVRGSS